MAVQTFDEFVDVYKPVKNNVVGSSFDGFMFETYGEELTFVRNQDPLKIWTIIDGEEGNLEVCAGYHLVNRIGYLIASVPREPEFANMDNHQHFTLD